MPQIQALVERIAQVFRPERVILFGSYAAGVPGPHSDVDLMVVVPHEGKCWEMAAKIRGRTRPEFPVDLVVRSPEQFRERLALGDVFLRDVNERGMVLYEADHE